MSQTLNQEVEKLSTPEPVAWIEKNFFIPETRSDPILRGRLQLQDYQKDTLREALSKDENGNYKYSIIVWSDIKKSIKSTIAAAVNLFRAHHSEWGEFLIIANDLKQADSRVAHYLRRCLQLNQELGNQYSQRGYRTTNRINGTFLEAIPIDPSGEAGSNADQITFSELWGANEDAKQTMWTEMTLSPTKRGKSFRWIESYAGFSEESRLLYSLYDLGVKQGELLWPERLYEVTDGPPTPLELYVNREAGMLCLWNTLPRCPWQTQDYYREEAKILPPNQFQRVHRNQWVSSSETFIPMEWYDACFRKMEDWPSIDKERHNMIIALDAAVSNDNFALLMGCRHPQKPDEVMVWYAKAWRPNKFTGKIDYQGTEEDPGPELVLRRLIKDYNVVQVCYDPYQLHDMSTRLKKELSTWFYAFSQGTDRLIADSQLRDVIRDRRLWHRGEPDLRDQIQNANSQPDEKNDSKVRLVKRVENLKIDLAVALSMCTHELLRLNL